MSLHRHDRAIYADLVVLVSAGNLLAFAATALVIIVIAGPAVLFVVGRAFGVAMAGLGAPLAVTGRRP